MATSYLTSDFTLERLRCDTPLNRESMYELLSRIATDAKLQYGYCNLPGDQSDEGDEQWRKFAEITEAALVAFCDASLTDRHKVRL